MERQHLEASSEQSRQMPAVNSKALRERVETMPIWRSVSDHPKSARDGCAASVPATLASDFARSQMPIANALRDRMFRLRSITHRRDHTLQPTRGAGIRASAGEKPIPLQQSVCDWFFRLAFPAAALAQNNRDPSVFDALRVVCWLNSPLRSAGRKFCVR